MTGQRLWKETDQLISLSEALDSLFLNTPHRQLAEEIFHWLREHIPYKCGVRLGEERITFLVGNYRPAALTIDAEGLGLYMVFVGRLPDSFELTYRFASIDVNEGHALIDSLPLPLSDADLESFVLACEKMGQNAAQGGPWICNVDADWPEHKPWPR
jgi:hypothetical protein